MTDDHDTSGAPDHAYAWADPTAGPWRADQIAGGEPVELCDGHRIDCMTAGGRHGTTHTAGTLVLGSDPAVVHPPGIDVGISFNDGKNLRAPDLSVGLDMSKPGWADRAPPLAVEYADHSQHEIQLQKKIAELLTLGTRIVWVVRLVGPLRVEVHEPGVPVRIVAADGELTAPGILQNPVPVRALIDPAASLEATLHNLLARKGYRDLDEVRSEGREEGREQALAELRDAVLAELAARDWTLPPLLHARITACADVATLVRWLRQTARSGDVEAALR